MPLLVDRPLIFAHLLVGLDPLLDSGEGGASAVLEGEESLLDESDGSHFDGLVGVCVLVNFLKSEESAKVLGFLLAFSTRCDGEQAEPLLRGLKNTYL